jgi:tetratricopeptide (TPR) repeat protein
LRLAEGAEEEGRQAMDQAAALAEASGNPYVLADFIAPVLSDWDVFHVRPEQIIARLDAMPWVRQRPGARVLPWLAEAHLQMDDATSAAALVAEGLPVARQTGHHLNLLAWLRAAAHLASRRGDSGEARALLDEALGLARTMPYSYMEAQLLVDRSQLSSRDGQMEAARTHLEEALAIFRRLGARPYVERTGQVLSGSLS